MSRVQLRRQHQRAAASRTWDGALSTWVLHTHTLRGSPENERTASERPGSVEAAVHLSPEVWQEQESCCNETRVGQRKGQLTVTRAGCCPPHSYLRGSERALLPCRLCVSNH